MNVLLIALFVKDHKYNRDWIAEQEAKGEEVIGAVETVKVTNK